MVPLGRNERRGVLHNYTFKDYDLKKTIYGKNNSKRYGSYGYNR